MKPIDRIDHLTYIKQAFDLHPVVAILGPRQCGKTTLARDFMEINQIDAHYFDLEDPDHISALRLPKRTLENLEGFVVIDEIQRIKELFPVIRTLVDRPNNQTKFLILGSSSRDLIQESSESLAGRLEYFELTPFSHNEVGNLHDLWIRGGFPKSFLASSDTESYRWREFYVRSYLERDMALQGIEADPTLLRRIWHMLAHYHGNIVNYSEIGKSLSISYKTVQRYIDILLGSFMIRKLQPWYENISKRQVKSPKIYFRDSGILHNLLNIPEHRNLIIHPKVGASWEGFALEEILKLHKIRSEDAYFWASQAGAELDLLLFLAGKKIGFEFKFTDDPRSSKSMHIAIEDLNLDRLFVIYPGKINFEISDKISVWGLENYLETQYTALL